MKQLGNMSRPNQLKKFIAVYAIVVALVVEVLFFGCSAPAFTKMENIFNVLRTVSIVGIMSVGMTFVIVSGGIDLSVGAICGSVGVIVAKFMVMGVHPVMAVLIGLVAGMIVGLINGFFVSTVGVPSMIATLGTMTSMRGVAYLVSNGIPIYGFTQEFTVIGQGYVGPVPIPVIIMAIIFVIGYLVLGYSKFGRYIYGIGSNEEASRLSGVNIKKVKYYAYIISGLLSAVAGVVLLSRLNSGIPKNGEGYEMDVITAVVLGGVSIKGGEGKLPLVIVGVLIMGVLSNGLVLLNVNTYVQQVIQGMVLLLAISFDRLSQSRGAKT